MAQGGGSGATAGTSPGGCSTALASSQVAGPAVAYSGSHTGDSIATIELAHAPGPAGGSEAPAESAQAPAVSAQAPPAEVAPSNLITPYSGAPEAQPSAAAASGRRLRAAGA